MIRFSSIKICKSRFSKPPFSIFAKSFFILFGSLLSLSGKADIRIDYPSERAVYQRDVIGYSTITVAGTYSSPVDLIEVRAVPVYPGQGVEVNWTALDSSPEGGVFSGEIRLFGGWYTLLVRGISDGKETVQAAVNRMGIGEVFIIAGQSNAQGVRFYPNGPAAQDERVNYINNNNNSQASLSDPAPPTFAHLNSSTAHLSPMGQGAWCWGVLGDRLVQRMNVPVLFINVAWEGTSIKNWVQSANNEPTYNSYGGFQYPQSMPYGNLSIAVKNYANTLGLRSILWMQGETDSWPERMSRSQYSSYLQTLMTRFGADIGKRIIWTIARTSRTAFNNSSSQSQTNQDIINAQNDVLAIPFNSVHPGPETDNLGLPRPDGVHFGTTEALTTLADAWARVMDENYFASITPLTPASVPIASAQCRDDNVSATLQLPSGYSSYRWSNGATTRTITVTSPGTYSATLKTDNGMTVISAPVRIESLKPARPTIRPTSDAMVCANSELEFSINGTLDYTWSADGSEIGKGSSLNVNETGSYTVLARNMLGCVSDVSVARKLTVLPEVTRPVVENAGPFNIMAEIKGDSIPFNYQWYKDGQVIPSVTQQVYKVSDLEPGQSGSYSVLATALFPNSGGTGSVSCPSEISEPFIYTMNSDEDLVLFPNPAPNGHTIIESREATQNVTVEVYDLHGKIVSTLHFAELRERQNIRLPLSAGTYIVKITAGEKEYMKRLILY